MDKNNKYGLGEKPPYQLYQAPKGKWGLIAGDGTKLDADFERLPNDTFSCCPWEVVTFNDQEGFEILAWYDPSEVWFNFTWDNPAYPEKYAAYLWQKCNRTLADIPQLADYIPHPYLDAMIRNDKDDVDDSDEFIQTLLNEYSDAGDFAATTTLLLPVMNSNEMPEELKRILWKSKVSLDYEILNYMNKKNSCNED